MKIALTGDIHANLPALEAVLQHAHAQGIEALWDLGDFLGFGSFPREVCKRLVKEHVCGVIGNYDRKILKFSKSQDKWRHTKDYEKFTAIRLTYEQLSRNCLNYASFLPEKRKFKIKGNSIFMIHASPASVKEHLGPSTPKSRFKEHAKLAKTQYVLCAHSHIPFIKKVAGTTFINPGSVGMPSDGDPRASYALLDVTSSGVKATLMRVPYDLQRVRRSLKKKGFPAVFAKIITGSQEPEILKKHKNINNFADDCISAAMRLGKKHQFNKSHAEQVRKLSLGIFDGLMELHELSEQERVLLECAALLHDVGVAEGAAAHNKKSMTMILAADMAPLNARERTIVALIARYHRKAIPSIKHQEFAALSEPDQEIVRWLAAILRVADGLDSTHNGIVKKLKINATDKEIMCQCFSASNGKEEALAAKEKSNLMEDVLGRKLTIKFKI